MLNKLINILMDGQTHSLEDIAISLDTDLDTVKHRIEHLEMIGVIKKSKINDSPSCDFKKCYGCSGCPSDITYPAIWELAK